MDNFYLDMNGIIHTATHGNDGVSKKMSEKDVILVMMAYIDQMVKIIKPARLLYMAIDGVAPRAKMNQQRSRRFRAARDLGIARSEAASRGEEHKDDEVFDSNCITPGTEFMATISAYIKFFVRRKLREDPLWQRMTVIFSGHEVPGEGEHKIVQFIRAEKLRPTYDPNTRHCMAGLDADLIMLALATHEPHFSLLREQVDFNAFRANKFGTKSRTRTSSGTKWQLLHVGMVREYLEMDMRPAPPPKGMPPPFAYDGERAVDDFVLLAALCGNDFMPHLPSLDIGEGALDALLKNYRENLYGWGGYLHEGGLICMERLEKLLAIMGAMERDVFSDREVEKAKFEMRARKEARRARAEGRGRGGGGGGGGGGDEDVAEAEISSAARLEAEQDMLAVVARRLAAERRQAMASAAARGGSGSSAEEELSSAAEEDPAAGSGEGVGGGVGGGDDDDSDGEAPAFVLDADDFKGRYYLDKFGVTYKRGSERDDAVVQMVVQHFAEALQWVMLYYYRGRPSWGWFFPFHYAPMTSDLAEISRCRIAFRLGRPFRPFQQLLGCLPAASAKFLPEPYRALMTRADSPIIAFFPAVEDIKVDMNGKRNSWEGVTLIPFINQDAMMAALAAHAPDSALSAAELQRNSFGVEYRFTHDPSAADTVASPNAAVFADLPMCQSRVEVFATQVPPVLVAPGAPVSVEDPDALIEVKSGFAGCAHFYSARPRAGCVVPAPGFPTLHSLRFAPHSLPVKIDIFGSGSRKDSVLVRPVGDGGPRDADFSSPSSLGGFAGGAAAAAPDGAYVPTFGVYAPDLAQADALVAWRVAQGGPDVAPRASARALAPELLGRVVFCDWPHLRAGLVTCVTDAVEECVWAGAAGVPPPPAMPSGERSRMFSRRMNRSRTF